MEAFIGKFQGSMYYMLGHPDSTLELFIIIALGLVIGTIIMTALGDVLDIANISLVTAALATIIGCVLTIGAVALCSSYLPGLLGDNLKRFIPLLGTFLAALLLIAPIICALLKGKYMSALVVWLAAVGGIALIVLAVGAVFDGVDTSKKSTAAEIERKTDIERLLE